MDLTEWCPHVVTDAGLSVSKYTGPKTPDGQTRVRVQLSRLMEDGGAREVMTFTIDEWLALGAAVNATTWERAVLPICYDSRCHHKALPHGRWPDCPGDREE